MIPCASCHFPQPDGDLFTWCACGRQNCRRCLIAMYDEDSTGPGDVAGWICQACADDLVASGHTEPAPRPRWAR